jgi:Ciliary BBSome complex subunit 2, middle region
MSITNCTALVLLLLQDFEVRLFREEETLLEITEADAVTHLCAMTAAVASAAAAPVLGTINSSDAPTQLARTGSFSGSASMYSAANSGSGSSASSGSSGAVTSSRGKWGYALANGTVGVYEKSKRVWRVKNKHQVCSTTGATVTTDVTTTVTSLIAVLVWFQWCCSSYSAVAAASADTVVVRGCCCCVCTYSGFV